mmetsp:Transcript_31552/g.40779  ORF Transcript_31552/g.40779 Transcript_31552/m.40779 type:complete len:93 (+) Transcript_31552:91-369(+)
MFALTASQKQKDATIIAVKAKSGAIPALFNTACSDGAKIATKATAAIVATPILFMVFRVVLTVACLSVRNVERPYVEKVLGTALDAITWLYF